MKTPGQVDEQELVNIWFAKENEHLGLVARMRAVIAHARPQIEAEMTVNMQHFADTVIEKLKGQIEAEARAVAVEESAQACERLTDRYARTKGGAMGQIMGLYEGSASECVDAIRALAALPPTHVVIEKPAVPIVVDGLCFTYHNDGMPEGIRDAHGYKIFFPEVEFHQGQYERYEKECAQLRARAKFILAALVAASKGEA